MVTLSFSEAIIAGLEQERAKACELNNLRLYKIAQGLLWVGEGKALGEVGRVVKGQCQDGVELAQALDGGRLALVT
jgi:hypothetical protein